MKKRINVTQKDILEAIEDTKFGKDICSNCPVARAFRRHKIFKNAKVNHSSAHEFSNGPGTSTIWEIKLPVFVGKWIDTFDDRHLRITVAPFQFTIEVPKCLIQQ